MAKFSEDPQGGSTKNISMFFYLKEDPGKELEVGQQEHKRPFELIFGKISHHSIYYILNVVLVWMFSSFHISALFLILAGGINLALMPQAVLFFLWGLFRLFFLWGLFKLFILFFCFFLLSSSFFSFLQMKK